jgi:hypothetical protein
MFEEEILPRLYPKSKREIRRHHNHRLRNKRKYHFGYDISQESKILSSVVNTPTPCSCWMCGNQRRLQGKTRQELKHEQIDIEQEKLLYYEDSI